MMHQHWMRDEKCKHPWQTESLQWNDEGNQTQENQWLDISYDIGIKTPVQDVPKLKYYRNSAENENRLADSKYHNPGDWMNGARQYIGSVDRIAKLNILSLSTLRLPLFLSSKHDTNSVSVILWRASNWATTSHLQKMTALIWWCLNTPWRFEYFSMYRYGIHHSCRRQQKLWHQRIKSTHRPTCIALVIYYAIRV